MERDEISSGDERDKNRRSARLVEKTNKSNGGDVQKGGDERGGDTRKRWR